MAEWSFAAVGRKDQSVGRCCGHLDAVAARRNHAALERSVAGGRLPALTWPGLWIARSVCAGRYREKRNGQGRWSGGLEIFGPGTRRADSSMGLDGTCRQPAPERECKRTLERRREELGSRRNRRGRSKIESPRNVSSRRRECTIDGTAPGFTGNTGFGFAGMVSRVPSRRRRGSDGRGIFYGRDDMAWMAACAGISRAFEQRRNREGAGLPGAVANRFRERRARTRHTDDWAGEGRTRRRHP